MAKLLKLPSISVKTGKMTPVGPETYGLVHRHIHKGQVLVPSVGSETYDGIVHRHID